MKRYKWCKVVWDDVTLLIYLNAIVLVVLVPKMLYRFNCEIKLMLLTTIDRVLSMLIPRRPGS